MPASIRWLDLPGLAEKGDVSDFIATFTNQEEAAERLAMMIDGAPTYEPPKTCNVIHGRGNIRTMPEGRISPGTRSVGFPRYHGGRGR